MTRKKLQTLITSLEKELAKFTETARKTLESSIKLQGASRSFAGDQEHAKQSAILNAEHKANLEKILKETKISASQSPPTTAQPVCHVTIKWENKKQTEQLFLITKPIFLKRNKFVSTSSPLGKALLNKKQNSTFHLKLPNNQNSIGKILTIE